MKCQVTLALLVLIGCKTAENKEASTMSMPGAYKMLSQHVKTDKIDTTYTGYEQMKIYTGDYMIYAGVNSPDSMSGFGIGTYNSSMDTVIENVFYSASDSLKSDSAASYTLTIDKTAKGYKQTIPEMKTSTGNIMLTEEYESVGDSSTSPLDGAWKQTKTYYIIGKDTTFDISSHVQYKAYGNGHVIWGYTYLDSAKKTHTGIGFGKFVMNGNKVKESMVASTYSDVRGKDFDADIVMDGADAFTQTIMYTDSSTGVEVYKRLKK